MEQLIKEFGPQAPVSVLLVIIVWLFLREIRSMHKENNVARKLDREVLENSTTANRLVLEKLSDAMLSVAQSNFQLAAKIEILGHICPLTEPKRKIE